MPTPNEGIRPRNKANMDQPQEEFIAPSPTHLTESMSPLEDGSDSGWEEKSSADEWGAPSNPPPPMAFTE